MPQTNRDQETFPLVRRTKVKTWLTVETMSPLGRELMDLAREIENSDEPGMSEEDLKRELALRRGEASGDG